MNKTLYVIALVLVLIAAGAAYKKHNTNSDNASMQLQYATMIVFKDKQKLYQLTTYDGTPVTSMVIQLKPVYQQVYKNVYINHRSQFVFSNGEGVTLQGEPLFWNRKGDIVTYDYKKIHEGSVFYAKQTPLRENTAMTLMELKNEIKAEQFKHLKDNKTLERIKLRETKA